MTAQPIPAAALAQHAIVLGKTGAGKSSVLRLIVEQKLSKGEPVCIVDPKGDWWGIKSSADGKSAGYPLVIFGGEHADVPINAHAGAQVAELFATGNRPCLIDLGGWMPGDRTRFFIDFASTLFRNTRGARWLVIDEVHNFAPQGKVMDPDAGKMLHWANRIITEGRGKGVTLLSASQRPQKVHKDFVTSNETLIAMRVIHELDRLAMKAWIDGCGDPEKGKEVLASLANMKRGEGWVWSPEIGFGPKRIVFPMFETYDSFAPQTSEADRHPKGWAEVDLEEVKSKLAAAIEQAKADDPRELRKKIADLENEISNRDAMGIDVEEVKRERASAKIEGYTAAIDALQPMVDRMQTLRTALDEQLGDLLSDLGKWRKTHEAPVATEKHWETIPRYSPTASVKHSNQFDASRSGDKPRGNGQAARSSSGSLPRGERAILIALAQYPGGCTREQLTVLTGYKRSSRDTYLQRLRERGFVESNGDALGATAAGIAELGPDYEPLPTGAALLRHWLERLPSGEASILELVVSKYPKPADRDWLSEKSGYQRSSRDTYIQRLRSRKLVDAVGRGEVKASDELFG